MGLLSTMQKAAQTAIKAVGDVAIATTYVGVANSSAYDPLKDVVQIQGTLYTSVKMVFTEFTANEIDGSKVLATDEKVLIANLDLTPTPKAGDRIHKSATDHWKVMDKEIDPASALWILQTRKVTPVSTIYPV